MTITELRKNIYKVFDGDFPKRALRHVLEWLDLHETELMDNWRLIQAGKPCKKIRPLE